MNRFQFEHTLKAAGRIAKVDELIVFGSQAIYGSVIDPPENLVKSIEMDLYVPDNPSLTGDIDGSLGEGSRFHDTNSYYAHGILPETVILPAEWRGRCKVVEIFDPAKKKNIRVSCLSPGDLAISKLAAGRDKDFEFVQTLIKEDIVKILELNNLVEKIPSERKEWKKKISENICICEKRTKNKSG